MGRAGRHRAVRRRRAGLAGGVVHQRGGRLAGRADRQDQADLAARQRRPALQPRHGARRHDLRGRLSRLRGGAQALGRKGHRAVLQPADRAARAAGERLHGGPRCWPRGGVHRLGRDAGRYRRHRLPGPAPGPGARCRAGRLSAVPDRRTSTWAAGDRQAGAVVRSRHQHDPGNPDGGGRAGRHWRGAGHRAGHRSGRRAAGGPERRPYPPGCRLAQRAGTRRLHRVRQGRHRGGCAAGRGAGRRAGAACHHGGYRRGPYRAWRHHRARGHRQPGQPGQLDRPASHRRAHRRGNRDRGARRHPRCARPVDQSQAGPQQHRRPALCERRLGHGQQLGRRHAGRG
ncbi:hypothetical protein D3C72_1026160 [compost metagenome]